jgi:hypothetical protein
MERSAGVIRPWHERREVFRETRETLLVPRTTYRYLGTKRGNPETELSGSLRTTGKAEKY